MSDKEALTLEETDEFSDTLMALESSVKKHLVSAKENKKEAGPNANNAAQPPRPPRSLSSLRRESSTMSSVKMPSRTDRVNSLSIIAQPI